MRFYHKKNEFFSHCNKHFAQLDDLYFLHTHKKIRVIKLVDNIYYLLQKYLLQLLRTQEYLIFYPMASHHLIQILSP